MWENFKSMPMVLKFLTFHALMCFSLFLVAIIPRDYFVLDGRHVSYGEWWSSGVGPLIAAVGLAMAMAGVLFLAKRSFGRLIYLATFGGSLTVPFLLSRDFLPAAIGAVAAAAMWAYLFRNPAVRAYFTSNNSFKPKPLRSGKGMA